MCIRNFIFKTNGLEIINLWMIKKDIYIQKRIFMLHKNAFGSIFQYSILCIKWNLHTIAQIEISPLIFARNKVLRQILCIINFCSLLLILLSQKHYWTCSNVNHLHQNTRTAIKIKCLFIQSQISSPKLLLRLRNCLMHLALC